MITNKGDFLVNHDFINIMQKIKCTKERQKVRQIEKKSQHVLQKHMLCKERINRL